MNSFRYVAKLQDSEEYQYFIGKFNDDDGDSIKFFVNDNGNVEKVIFIDDAIVSAYKYQKDVSFLVSIEENINSLSDKKINELINKLLD